MKKPFNEAETFWQAVTVAALIILIIVIAASCGCRSTSPERGAMLRVIDTNTAATKPPRKIPKENPIKIPFPKTLRSATLESARGGGGNGVDSVSPIPTVRSFEVPCGENVFGLCSITYYPCATNEFESFDMVDDPSAGRWYCGTNVIGFWAESGWTYVPEFLSEGEWKSFCVINGGFLDEITQVGVMLATNLHYLDYGDGAIYRVSKYQRPETYPPEPEPE